MITVKEVKKLRAKYESNRLKIAMTENMERRNRLKALVEKFGIEIVSAATGLTLNTIVQYCRVKYPPAISEDKVKMAETILTKR